LISCERVGLGRASYRLLGQHEFTQMLLGEHLPENHYAREKVAHRILTTKRMEPSLAIGRAMRRRGQRLRDYGMRSRDVTDKVQNIFKGLGIIRRRRIVSRDYIGEALVRLYDCPPSTFWKALLYQDYEYALQILLEAEAAYNIDRSGWMRNQNSFNDMLVRAIIAALKAKRLPGGSVKLLNANNKLVSFGNLVQAGSAFDQNHPLIASGLREFNERRNTLPGSHPYSTKGGARNEFLTGRERDRFAASLKVVFVDVISMSVRNSLVS